MSSQGELKQKKAFVFSEGDSKMPMEVFEEDEFLALVPLASVCYVKRVRDSDKVKLKLRTKKSLYTYVTDTADAQKVLGKINIPVEDI